MNILLPGAERFVDYVRKIVPNVEFGLGRYEGSGESLDAAYDIKTPPPVGIDLPEGTNLPGGIYTAEESHATSRRRVRRFAGLLPNHTTHKPTFQKNSGNRMFDFLSLIEYQRILNQLNNVPNLIHIRYVEFLQEDMEPLDALNTGWQTFFYSGDPDVKTRVETSLRGRLLQYLGTIYPSAIIDEMSQVILESVFTDHGKNTQISTVAYDLLRLGVEERAHSAMQKLIDVKYFPEFVKAMSDMSKLTKVDGPRILDDEIDELKKEFLERELPRRFNRTPKHVLEVLITNCEQVPFP